MSRSAKVDRRAAEEAPRIAINGRHLDEVQTPMERSPGWPSRAFLRFPAHRHSAHLEGDTLTLRMRALTALQLYFDGTLPVDRNVPVDVRVGIQNLGLFRVEALECAERFPENEPVIVRFSRVKSAGCPPATEA